MKQVSSFFFANSDAYYGKKFFSKKDLTKKNDIVRGDELLIRGYFMRTSKKDITTEKENGRIYTPDYIVRNILDLSGYYGLQILKKHSIDNSCGDGAFLCEIIRRYCKAATEAGLSATEIRADLSEYIHGIEINAEEHRKCIENISKTAYEFGVEGVVWDVLCGDTLSIHKYDGEMDYVLGNPPYVRVHNLGDNFDEIKGFMFSQGGMTDLFIVFFEIGIRMLNSTGTLGYITPSSYFNSLAGAYMRRVLCRDDLLDKVVDLKHYQAFNATTYTAISILKKNRKNADVEYFQFDEKALIPYYVDTLSIDDYLIAGNYYFACKSDLAILHRVYGNRGESDIQVKNGYATLCDGVFINDFDFESDLIIPVVKASRGIQQRILYPYDRKARLLPEEVIKQDENVYRYLISKKDELLRRSSEKESEEYWYSFGRSQALLDTYRNKVAISALLRDERDLKFVEAPIGTGVYSGLYIVSDNIPMNDIIAAMKSDEFVRYIRLLGKYKSGGYYTYSSKDVKAYLDYKFAYNGGLLEC